MEANLFEGELSDILVPDQSAARQLLTDLQSRHTSRPSTVVSRLQFEVSSRKSQAIELAKFCNTLIPIFSLPPELLSQIMLYYAMSETQLLFTLKWTVIMEVCSMFRKVGVSLRPPWSFVCVEHTSSGGGWPFKRISIQLDRSGSCPITAVIHCSSASLLGGGHPDVKYFVNSAVQNALAPLKLRSLHLQGTFQVLEIWRTHYASVPHPKLESLHLESLQMVPNHSSLSSSDLFGTSTSPVLLRSLCLKGISVDLSLPRSLTKLSLNPCFTSYQPLDEQCHSLLKLFKRCPRLKDLNLVFTSGYQPADIEFETDKLIRLSSLERIGLRGPPDLVGSLLECLEIHSLARIILWNSWQSNDAGTIFRSLHRSLQTSNINISALPYNVLVLENLGFGLFTKERDLTCTRNLAVAKELDNGSLLIVQDAEISSFLVPLLGSIKADELTHLDVRNMGRQLHEVSWLSLLDGLPNLTHTFLRPEHSYSPDMIRHLSSYPHSKICNIGIDLLAYQLHPRDNGRSIQHFHKFFEALYIYIKERRRKGHSVRRIEIMGWHVVPYAALRHTPKDFFPFLSEGIFLDGKKYDPVMLWSLSDTDAEQERIALAVGGVGAEELYLQQLPY